LIIAAATNRTLVLESDGKNWPFRKELSKRLFQSKIGWESIFLPITKCLYADAVSVRYIKINQIEEERDGQTSNCIIRFCANFKNLQAHNAMYCEDDCLIWKVKHFETARFNPTRVKLWIFKEIRIGKNY
jgi:hypothetical protein